MRPFYTIYCKANAYNFVFTLEGQVMGLITLTNPLCDDQTIEVSNDFIDTTNNEGLAALASDPQRLCREAMTMQREYMQGASGFLPADATFGQMLFGMDLEEWSSI